MEILGGRYEFRIFEPPNGLVSLYEKDKDRPHFTPSLKINRLDRFTFLINLNGNVLLIQTSLCGFSSITLETTLFSANYVTEMQKRRKKY